jgi:hypothetical protein
LASEVDISNRALQKLGAKRIVSLSDASSSARACNAAYPSVRDALYEDHDWNFTIERVQLPADSATPEFGKSYSYTLPADFIRLAPPYPEENDPSIDWQIENGCILTNYSPPLNVRYVSRVIDPNKMTPLFRELLATEMAFELCEEITQSNVKKSQLDSDREKIMRKAKRSNAMQNVSAEPPEDSWITARA